MRFLLNFKLFILIASLVLISGCVNKWKKDKTYDITILHTNDHHGHFWSNDNGEYGLAAQKTMVDAVRQQVLAKGGNLLLLSGGDINTGVPESSSQNAEPDFLGMNLIGYDAMAIGNHEFDNSLNVLRQQEKWAKFPLLSANVYKKGTDQRLFKPYQLFYKQGIKIAVIGLTTNDTQKIGNPEYLTGIEFRLPAVEARRLIEKLRKKENPDVIIAVTHMGHYDDGNHGSNAPGDVEMARSLPVGYLDMIVGGHSHNSVCMDKENHKQVTYIPGTTCLPDRQNGTWIMQAHEWGKYVGRADFKFRNGELTLVNYQLIPINLKKKIDKPGRTGQAYYTQKISHDPAMITLLTPFKDKAKAKLGVKIGRTNGKLEGDHSKVRLEQSNLARLVLTALEKSCRSLRTDAGFAVLSSGVIRGSIESGDITYKDVLKVLPFSNALVCAEMKGSQVVKYLEVVANKEVGSGAYAQFFNISLAANGTTVSNVQINGKPLEENKSYWLATLNFNALGGDGYPILSSSSYVNTGLNDAEVLKQYITQYSSLDAAQYQPKGEIIYNKLY